MTPYYVTVRRRGSSPLEATLLVRAPSKDEAGGLAAAIAERRSGGMFEARKVRGAPAGRALPPADAYDDAA
jgi:hypothetical protein